MCKLEDFEKSFPQSLQSCRILLLCFQSSLELRGYLWQMSHFSEKFYAFVNHSFILPHSKFCGIGFITIITCPPDFIVIRIGMMFQDVFAGKFLIAYFTPKFILDTVMSRASFLCFLCFHKSFSILNYIWKCHTILTDWMWSFRDFFNKALKLNSCAFHGHFPRVRHKAIDFPSSSHIFVN